ncbi:Putative uncharacterized protein [Halomonas sp. R57-5]|jgi:hypothetical protein|uniref:YfjI family protein n=1 Tax=Halomonas sp. R57-5 TaxID=1610576 RepID=UPI0005FCD14E|nr:YfjI family protein [Halomonas sp. R57-5]CEP36099.1 Putative uncharacterized protein [Halomonas sp. R57-5]
MTVHRTPLNKKSQPKKTDIIDNAARELSHNIQIDQKMALAAYISAASTALQGVIDVKWPDGRISPTSLNTLTLASSGERKTTAFSIAHKVVFEKNSILSDYNDITVQAYERENCLWTRKYKSIENKIGRDVLKGKDTRKFEDMLNELLREKPEKPLVIDFIYKDATSEALMNGISERSKFVSLISSEGAGILNGGAFRNFSAINDLWSGDAIKVDRKSSASSYVKGARLTVGIMVQPGVMDAFNKKGNNEHRNSGLWARFLAFVPESRIGQRTTGTWKSLSNSSLFDKKSEFFLNKQIEILKGESERYVMSLSNEAKPVFERICVYIESNSVLGMRYSSFADLASKMPENIIRLAAIMSAFDEGIKQPISVNSINRAIQIVMNCADDFIRVFYVPTKEEIDDNTLTNWLNSKKKLGYRYFKKNYIRRHVNPSLRSNERLEPSIQRLESKGVLCTILLGNVQCVDTEPLYAYDPIAANREIFGTKSIFNQKY